MISVKCISMLPTFDYTPCSEIQGSALENTQISRWQLKQQRSQSACTFAECKSDFPFSQYFSLLANKKDTAESACMPPTGLVLGNAHKLNYSVFPLQEGITFLCLLQITQVDRNSCLFSSPLQACKPTAGKFVKLFKEHDDNKTEYYRWSS